MVSLSVHMISHVRTQLIEEIDARLFVNFGSLSFFFQKLRRNLTSHHAVMAKLLHGRRGMISEKFDNSFWKEREDSARQNR